MASLLNCYESARADRFRGQRSLRRPRPRLHLAVAALTVAGLVAGLLPVPAARAEKQDARKHYDQATAAFGLGRYGDAAAEYEAAFRLRPDPALLYNCAQSYRLAGNKPRALELYRNYLRLYGDAANTEDARKHIGDLELQLAADKAAATPTPALGPTTAMANPSPATPTAPSPRAATPAPIPSAPIAPPPVFSTTVPSPTPSDGPQLGSVAQPTLTLPSNGGDEATSLVRRPWFWVAIGAVLVGGTVAVLLATRSEKDPPTTLGTVVGN